MKFLPHVLLMGLTLGLALTSLPSAGAGPAATMITLEPTSGPPTTRIAVTGEGFGPSEVVEIRIGTKTVGSAATDVLGGFMSSLDVPASAPPGRRIIRARGMDSGLTASAPFVVRTNWPHFRYDGDHTGVNPYENILSPSNVPRMQLDWQAQLGEPVYGSSPAVVDGVVYIGSLEGSLWAFDENGCGGDFCTQPLWRGDLGAQTLSSPTVANGFVYIDSQTSPTNNDGKLDVFDARGCGQPVCQPLWKGLAGGSSGLESAPAVTADRAYVASYDGHLYAFDANGCGEAICRPLWRAILGGPSDSSPVVHDGVVFIGSSDGNLYAFDAGGCGHFNCLPLWTGSVGPYPIFQGSPAIANGLVYVGRNSAEILAFKAKGCGQATCGPIWTGDTNDQVVDSSPAIVDGRLYIGSTDKFYPFSISGRLYVFDVPGASPAG